MVDRKSGHLLVVTRALLFHCNVFKHYWGEAGLIATLLISRLPSQNLDSHSPIQLLTNTFLEFHASSCLTPKVFSCVTFVHVHIPNRGKLDSRALKCVFIRYSSTQIGYKCYHPPIKSLYISWCYLCWGYSLFCPNLPLGGEYITRG